MTNITSYAKQKKSGNAALPPRPYSEYTIFFRLERSYLLQSTGIIDDEVLQSLDPNHHDPLEFPRPARYQSLAMPPYWYSSSHKKAFEKKRKHRKREGRMDLKMLSKTISASWRNCDSDIPEYCKRLARAEWTKNHMTVLLIKAEQEADKAVKPVHNNGALSHEDFVVQPSKSQVQAQAAGSMPVITPHIAHFMNGIQNNFNAVMGYGQINEGQNNDAAFLEMRLLQQLQATAGTDNTPINCAHSTSPLNTHYRPIPSTSYIPGPSIPEKKQKFVRRALAPPKFADIKPYMGLNISSNYFGTNNDVGLNSADFLCGFIDSNANVSLGEDSSVLAEPEKEIRHRTSMTSMPIHQDQVLKQMQHPFTISSMPGPTGQSMFCGNTGSNDNVFIGEDSSVLANPEKKMRCRASMTNVRTHEDQEVLKRMRRRSMDSFMPGSGQPSTKLSSSFTKQFQRGSFSCVPEWKEEDADALLDMLNEPEVRDEVGRDDFVISASDQDINIMTAFTEQQNYDDLFGVADLCEQFS